MRTAQVDGDILIYKAGFSAQRTLYRFVYNDGSKIDYSNSTLAELKKDLKSRGISHNDGHLQKLIAPEPLDFACRKIKMLLDSILNKTEADSFNLYLTANDKSNFRFKLATIKEYKGNRKNMKKPVHYEALREFLITYYGAEVIFDQEADDAMGIAQMNNLSSSIICSIDKDMNMIPGYHYNIDSQETYISKDPGELRLSDDRKKIFGTGLKWFYAQMLMGDNADNIPGIPGFGPVKTFEMLSRFSTENDFKSVVEREFKECYTLNWEKAFKEVANLLWIRRYADETKFK